jgi:hypothetical protein
MTYRQEKDLSGIIINLVIICTFVRRFADIEATEFREFQYCILHNLLIYGAIYGSLVCSSSKIPN